MGETGENGNAWFTAVVKTLEANKIGYSNWSYKPYDKIQSPITIKPFANWQKVLDYVNNDMPLSAANCIAYLKQMTDGLLLENCRINKDEIDAWTRQPYDDTPLPYAKNDIPGVVFAANYDLGTQGIAYSDKVVQTLSQSNWTAWNNGYVYRNDGVDMEACTDVAPYNLGYNVGWTEDDEWMLYTVNVATTGVYDLNVRCANGTTSSGMMHVEMDGDDITGNIAIAATGGYTSWQNFTVTGITLSAGSHKMKVYVDKGGFNINALEWKTSTSTPVFKLMSATAVNDTTVKLIFNMPLNSSATPALADFKINSATSHSIKKISFDANNASALYLISNSYISYTEILTLDYTGTTLVSATSEQLPTFTSALINNVVPKRYAIAGKVEAENFIIMSGLQLEACTDAGGGQDVGYTDAGDYLEYSVYVKTPGIYDLTFRMAGNGGKATLSYKDAGNSADIATVTFSATGDWQTWKDFVVSAELTAGAHTLRLSVVQSGFNLNYMKFVLVTSSLHTDLAEAGFDYFPNPVESEFTLKYNATSPNVKVEVLDLSGAAVVSDIITNGGYIEKQYQVSNLASGIYVIRVIDEQKIVTKKMVVK